MRQKGTHPQPALAAFVAGSGSFTFFRHPLAMRSYRLDIGESRRLIGVHAGAALVLALILASVAPSLFWLALAALVTAGLLFLAFRHTALFCVGWLFITGASIEMTLNDLIGPEAFQGTIAMIKAADIVLAMICALRWGARSDIFNPAWALIAIAAAGMAHGLYPGLTPLESARSLIGSIAPFAFCFACVPPAWGGTMISAVRWCPVVAVIGGLVLEIAGMRPLFIDSGGLRLAGLGHPAFLAGVCLPAIYAGLIGLYRSGKPSELLLLGVNFLILLLTGARAPLFYAAMVAGLSLTFVDTPACPAKWRYFLLLVLAAGLPVVAVLVLSGDLASVRLFALLNGELGNLSGREYLWPPFEAAAAASPWVGWGIGAGNAIIPPDSQVARLVGTFAAHNEYLRMEVEGGQIGRALLFAMFGAWAYRHTGRLDAADRRIMRFAFLALACHALTDNVLISTPACVLFAFAAAVFARGRDGLPDSTKMA